MNKNIKLVGDSSQPLHRYDSIPKPNVSHTYSGNVVEKNVEVFASPTFPNSISIIGSDTVLEPGQYEYVKLFDTNTFTGVLQGINWSLAENTVASLLNSNDGGFILSVASLPNEDTIVTVTCTAMFKGGRTVESTKSITIQKLPVYPTISITGFTEIEDTGDNEYSVSITGTTNMTISSRAWSLTTSQNASITSLTVSSCTVTVSDIPAEDETLTLTYTTTFDNGHVITETKSITIKASSYQFVDLGLPSGIKWATMNVGADTETDAGLYFSWGNVEDHAEGSGYDFSDANYNASPGKQISGDIALSQDAANAYCGGDCRMPTRLEFQELYDNCDSAWVTESGVTGRRFTSKTNGNSIFFPAAGFYDDTTLNNLGSIGSYWSASRYSDSQGYNLRFSSGFINPQNNGNRRCGFSVRAVKSAQS